MLTGKLELDAGVDIETMYDGSLKITRPERMSTAKLLGKLDREGYKILSIDWEKEEIRALHRNQTHPTND
jgi:hypothetical protein